MIRLHTLLLISTLLAGCGYVLRKDEPTPLPTNQITEGQKQELIVMRNQIRTWARECTNGIACGTDADGAANDGDSMLWAGMLCLSGEQQQCEAVRLSVDSEGGLHRNPDRNRTKNSFSRDMMIGFLAYLAKTGDHVLGSKVHDKIIVNDFKLCSDADDNRCFFNQPQYTAGWNIWYEIWQHYSFKPTEAMVSGNASGEVIANIQAAVAAEGYPRHLVGVQLFIRTKIGNWTIFYQNSAEQLLKLQPYNPFFEYLANGPTRRSAQIVLDKCPSQKPLIKSNDWAWQRDESEQAWNKSKGWDCIFMVNVLLGNK